MVERMQKGFNLTPKEEEMRNDNYVIEKDSDYYAMLDDGTELKLPHRLGRVLYLGLKVLDKHINKYGPVVHSNREDKKVDEKRLQSFDCHSLVTVSLGLYGVDIKNVLQNSVIIIRKLFEKEAPHRVEDVVDFNSQLSELMRDDRLGIVTIYDGYGRLTHSMIVLRGNKKLYAIQKAGTEGMVLFADFNTAIDRGFFTAYGRTFAYKSYDDCVITQGNN